MQSPTLREGDSAPQMPILSTRRAPASIAPRMRARSASLLPPPTTVTASGRDAVGARISVTTGRRKQIDEVRSGGYHISQGDFRVHFGLGQATRADVSIRWPQGLVETLKDVEGNQWIVVREGKGIVERHRFSGLPARPFNDNCCVFIGWML